MVNFTRKLPNCFHSGYIIYSPTRSFYMSFQSTTSHYFALSEFIFCFVGMKWYLTLLTCMILVISEIENLLICSRTFWLSCFVKYLFNIFCSFFYLVVMFLLIFRNSLYILDTTLLSVYGMQISSLSFWYVFLLYHIF